MITRESHDEALLEMIDQIAARLTALRIARLPALVSVDLSAAQEQASRARRAIETGIAGYILMTAERPPV